MGSKVRPRDCDVHHHVTVDVSESIPHKLQVLVLHVIVDMAAAAAPKVFKPDHKLVGHLSKEPRLAGKVCLVSGAGRGFGQAIAIRFAEEGAKVVAFSRSG